MTDYNTLLSQARTELASLQKTQAVQSSRIADLVQKLNLDPTQDLMSQVNERLAELQASKAQLEAEIEEVLKQLDPYDSQY